jgi:hypothetical protein
MDDVPLSPDERDLILLALWRLKATDVDQRAVADNLTVDDVEMGITVATGIDGVAFKLGGKDEPVYGLGQPPD